MDHHTQRRRRQPRPSGSACHRCKRCRAPVTAAWRACCRAYGLRGVYCGRCLFCGAQNIVAALRRLRTAERGEGQR
jgi:hypothetical protein